MASWRDRLFAFMAHNALSATAFFQIPGIGGSKSGRRSRNEPRSAMSVTLHLLNTLARSLRAKQLRRPVCVGRAEHILHA